jgi:hypothetical protein
MRRVLAVLVVAWLAAACGGGAPAGGDGGGGGGPSGAAPAAGGAVPPGSSVYFGSAYDANTYAVADKSTNIKAGSPIVAVGKALAPIDGTAVQLEIKANGNSKPLRPPDAMDNPSSASFFASDLSKDGLTPGTWIISYVLPGGRIVASGFLTISP